MATIARDECPYFNGTNSSHLEVVSVIQSVLWSQLQSMKNINDMGVKEFTIGKD